MAKTTWLDAIGESEKSNPLTKDMTVDVLIIGAGLTGVSAAYQLSQSGKSVIVIDKDSIQNTVTAYTTAFLTYYIDNDASAMISMFGRDQAKLMWQSHASAIHTIEDIVTNEDIHCDFMRCDEYIIAQKKKEQKDLEEEYKAAKELGFRWKLTTTSDLPLTNEGYITIPQQAKFHPLLYLLALKTLAEKRGVSFFNYTEAVEISGNDPVVVKTPKATITAQKVLIATYDPFNQPKQLFAHKGMYTSYVMEAEIPKNVLAQAIYQDVKNPYHYFRVDKGKIHDRLIVGGEDHREEIPMDEKKNFTALEEFMHKTFPDLTYTIKKRWTGPILETIDGLAYIGSLVGSPNQFVAIGFSGNGMTYATIASLLFKDFVLGKTNPWFDIYKTSRVPTPKQLYHKTVDYVGELVGGAVMNMTK